MASAQRLIEDDIYLIKNYLVANMGAALSAQNALRPNGKVSLEIPKEYLTFPQFKGLRPPSVFVIDAGDMDFKKSERQANYVTALSRLQVGVVVEDKDMERIYIKSYRYIAAIFSLLNQTVLTSADGNTKLITVVKSTSFSSVFTNADDKTAESATFRREASLRLEVDHYENL